MQLQNNNRLLVFCLALFLFLSCSLDYSDRTSSTSSPELVLHDVEFSRTEDGNVTVRLFSNTIESYRSDNTFFAENIYFTALDKDGELVSNGNAKFLFADQNNELYSLLDEVKIHSPAFDTEVEAKNLRWNNKTEQLTSSKYDVVRLTRGTLNESPESPSENTQESNQVFVIEGSGFSSDMFTQEFSFNEYISGSITERQSGIKTATDEDEIEESSNEIISTETLSIEELPENDK